MACAHSRHPLRPGLPFLLLALAAAGPALAGNTGAQRPPIQLGTSGSTIDDRSGTSCCTGTLGSLVTLDGQPYILSNNHVLARAGGAPAGVEIIQPGLIDVRCGTLGTHTVATFAGDLVPLGTANVDTALAKVIPGQVDHTGAILGLGVPCAATAAAAPGLAVTKSGRTTGVTKGTVEAVDVTVSVEYQKKCNDGPPFPETYVHQIAIGPGCFAAPGDSGSLILTDPAKGGRRPVGLLFAGSSSFTIANPIGDVAAAYQAGGHSFGFVGSKCRAGRAEELLVGPSQLVVERARAVKEAHEAELLSRPHVLGVGVGRATGEPAATAAAIVVFVESSGAALPLDLDLPDEVEGVRVRVLPTDRFVAR